MQIIIHFNSCKTLFCLWSKYKF